MIKKQLLVILATIVLSFSAFAQNFEGGDGTENNPYQISTKDQFLAISDLTKHYKQIADIDLGDLGTLGENEAIITGDFSGTYDGGGHSISYSVKFVGNSKRKSFGLFEEVKGTIKNLNIISSSAMLSGNGKDMNIGLICGLLCSNGVITDCHVTGNINSTVTPYNDNNELEDGAGSDAGLIAGQSLGKIKYSSGTGNVVGVGYAGGLVGQLNDRWGQYSGTDYGTNNGEIIGCSFVGSVTALKPYGDYDINDDMGNFAGGICGLVSKGEATNEISLSYANATVVSDGGCAYGLASFSDKAEKNSNSGYGSYDDIYVKGEVNDDNIDTYGEISNISSGNRYENTNHNSVEINSTLNDVVDDTDEANQKIYFSRETGEIILVFGRPIATDCNPPQNLKINVWSKGNGNRKYNLYTAKWTLEESVTWVYELKKVDDGSITTSGTIYDNDSITLGVNNRTSNNGGYELLASGEYVLSVRRKCNDGVSLSDYATAAINIQNNNCSSVGDLSASDITYNSATITWEETTADTYEFKLNDGEAETLTDNSKDLTGLNPNTLYKVEVRSVCSPYSKSLVEVIEFVTPDATVEEVPFVTIKDGNFEQPGTWNRNSVPTGNNEGTITINHEVVLNSTLTLNGNTTINIDHSNGNKGVLKIDQQGQLITTSTTNDVIGIVEILTPIIGQKKWAFLGAPFVTASDANNYKLETIMPETGSDIIVSFYEYGSRNDWSADRDVYATYQYEAKTGEGYLGFPFYDGVVSFTSYGDLWDFEQGGIKEYDARPALYKLNNSDVTINNENSNKWTPLSNPYPAQLSIEKFLSENSYTIQEQVVCKFQGQGVYKLANAEASAFDLVSTGEIKMTEGFFVKLLGEQTEVDFSQTQLTNYPTTSAKSAVEREFIELALVQNNHASKLYFAHNEQAEQGYDIFDADKLFAMTEMTEPYFVTEGKELVKEEVAELPYYATMNVRSFEQDSVSFVANNIPQGYSVSIIDGEETIELTESSAYSTLVSRGENANRFKLLIKKSVGLGEVEELEVEITNNNRLVNVSSTEEDLQIEVYNALGQKVFATKDRNFTLNNVSAGAYVVKAFNNTASKTQKIVIK